MKKLIIILGLMAFFLTNLKIKGVLSLRCIPSKTGGAANFYHYSQKGIKDVTSVDHVDLEKGDILIVKPKDTTKGKDTKDKTVIHIATGG